MGNLAQIIDTVFTNPVLYVFPGNFDTPTSRFHIFKLFAGIHGRMGRIEITVAVAHVRGEDALLL